MSGFTYASAIILDAEVEAAREHFGPGYFPVPLSEDGSEPATFWMGTGPWENSELDYLVNEPWAVRVYFGQDWQAALNSAGLQVIQPAVETDNG